MIIQQTILGDTQYAEVSILETKVEVRVFDQQDEFRYSVLFPLDGGDPEFTGEPGWKP